ncbi:uncharacterized protein BDW43DRAFT_314695 [Aspergillus alliaceus]|uniref:uncharacterized protein n=1 Tax=Petromyces alliaceus TaxID=209559 RepID=UPI0012A76100|nr:uncharacterized protein BDW43DRAFT_314695 [Aspergillus alliaceus]KAB8229659.1 hypothetical protein BDW43DRAFT_314695 [Aspergillus alliaceus]
MYQSKLEQYVQFLSPPFRHGCSFLDLPDDIRCYIYRLTGVVRKCPIYLYWDPRENRNILDVNGDPIRCLTATAFDLDCDCHEILDRYYYRPIPVSLFCCSRDVYREASTLFYNNNRFYIQYTGPDSFGAIMGLRPMTLSMISYLHIVLHQANKDSSLTWCDCSDREIQRDPLRRMPPRRYRDLTSGWKAVCMKLAKSIAQSRVEMCLICDTDDINVAAEVLSPLPQLPLLAAFSVRFAHPWSTWNIPRENSLHVNLYHMAREVSMEITGRISNHHKQTFKYNLLPAELQLRILEHTALVAPEGYLAWSPDSGFSSLGEFYEYRWDPRLHCCRLCDPLRIVCCRPMVPKGGTWVSQCNKCWKFPLSLFLVNRRFYQEATHIFWSLNRFVVFDTEAYPSDVIGPFPPILEPVHLATFMSPYAMRYLRYLQFNSPPNRGDALKAYKEMIELLRRSADLPRLTITLNLREMQSYEYEYQEPISEEEEIQTYLELYTPLIIALVPLRALKDFFVHIGTLRSWRDCVENKRALWERRLETMVMGMEYRSSERVKRDVLLQWHNPYGVDN